MTNFESATRNTLLWRVPGQSTSSQGRNNRLVEMLDLFPTLVELAGLPPIPQCTGLDQPTSVGRPMQYRVVFNLSTVFLFHMNVQNHNISTF